MDDEYWYELEEIGYDESRNFDTAFSRLEFGVEISLPSQKRITRSISAKEGEIDDELVWALRKKIAKYGVRARHGGNHHRFITTHQMKLDFAQLSKLTNKRIGEVQKEYKDWRARRTNL